MTVDTHKCNFWLSGEKVEGANFIYNTYVEVISGEHRGVTGSLVSLVTLGTNARYIIEKESGSYIEVAENEIKGKQENFEVNENTVDFLVNDCWIAVKQKVESGAYLSSEKTLCFSFAMELVFRVGRLLQIDFENQCYDNLNGASKYLDLLFYTDDAYKVALEFKLPTRSKSGNSNQTQTRESVYRDLARLKYLKENTLSTEACYFLMATNESAYLKKGNYKKGLDFVTANGHIIKDTNNIVAEGLSLSGIQANFSWSNIDSATNLKLVKNAKYAWLNPIRI